MWTIPLLVLFAISAQAGPIPIRPNRPTAPSLTRSPRSFTMLGPRSSKVVVFDAPGYPDPNGQTLASFQVFACGRAKTMEALEKGVKWFSQKIADTLQQQDTFKVLAERIDLIIATPLKRVMAQVEVAGCTGKAIVGPTDSNGVTYQTVSIGQCSGTSKPNTFSINGALSRVYYSPNSGWGVISDIDDTIKASNVLNIVALLKATFFDQPQAIHGMPNLYAQLAMTLQNPQFLYLSASPLQLYPFLHRFIHTAFPRTPGPILLQNLTLSDISGLRGFVSKQGALEYKMKMIRRIHEWYPNKQFYLVGDSGQADPETYGQAYREFGGGFVRCIWIRLVGNGPHNTQARFQKAFRGVPHTRWRSFNDAGIDALQEFGAGDCNGSTGARMEGFGGAEGTIK